jgi:hypothetical protein
MPTPIPSVQQLVKSYEAKQRKLNTNETKPPGTEINVGKKPDAPACGSELGPVSGLPKKTGNKIFQHS